MLDAILSTWNYLAANAWAALINALPLSCIVTGIVWLLLDRNKKLSATAACCIWSSVLAFTVLLPFAQALVPHAAGATAVPPSCTLSTPGVVSSAPVVNSTLAISPPIAPEAASVLKQPGIHFQLPVPLPSLLLAIWFAAILVQFVRLAFALRYSLALKHSAAAPSGALKTRWQYLLDNHYGSRRPVDLGISSAVSVPSVVGYRRPMVLLPVSTVDLLDTDGLDAILIHELAHVRRRDDWAIAVQRIVEAIFVLHPLVHLITSKLELQREIACDDWVLASKERCSYAYSLTTIAEVSVLSPHVSLMGLVVEQPSQLSQRIEKLLDTTRPVATGLSRKSIGSLIAAIGLLSFASLYIPNLMAAPAAADPMPVVQAPAPPKPPVAPVLVDPQCTASLARQQAKLAREQAELAKKQRTLTSEQMRKAQEQLKLQMQQMRQQLKQQLRVELPQQIDQQVFASIGAQMAEVSKEIARINTEEITRNAMQLQAQMRNWQSRMENGNIRPDLKAKLDQLQARQRQLAAEQQETVRELQRTLNEALHDSIQKGMNQPVK